ncbi:MAG: hypothetical protein ABI746_11690, partial [Dermatophilaceae bacterium]
MGEDGLMARNSYPHMVFVQPDAGLDKESLTEALSALFPDGAVVARPLRLDLDVDGYVFSFWFEEAEGVAEMYATYLPEGARRRWLSRCEAMIDFHGAPDPHGERAGDAVRIASAMYDCDGVEVFSEDTKRFLGMDYGEASAPAAQATHEQERVPAMGAHPSPVPPAAPQPPQQEPAQAAPPPPPEQEPAQAAPPPPPEQEPAQA